MRFEPHSNAKDAFSKLFLEYAPISTAPKDILSFKEAWGLRGEDLDNFERLRRAEDRLNWYKAMDEYGNIYRVRNPWSWAKNYTRQDGMSVLRIPPKELLATAADAAKALRDLSAGIVHTTSKKEIGYAAPAALPL